MRWVGLVLVLGLAALLVWGQLAHRYCDALRDREFEALTTILPSGEAAKVDDWLAWYEEALAVTAAEAPPELGDDWQAVVGSLDEQAAGRLRADADRRCGIQI